MVWFGDEKWVLKIFEYRINWWEKEMHKNGSKVTVELI